MSRLFLAFAFCAFVLVGCKTTAGVLTTKTDKEGNVTSEGKKYETGTDLDVQSMTDKLLKQLEEQKAREEEMADELREELKELNKEGETI